MSIVRARIMNEAENKSPEELGKLSFYAYRLGNDTDDVDGLAEALLGVDPGTPVVCFRAHDTDWFCRGTEADITSRVEELPDVEEEEDEDGPFTCVVKYENEGGMVTSEIEVDEKTEEAVWEALEEGHQYDFDPGYGITSISWE